MRTYSACVPLIKCPRIQPPSSQCEYICFLQYSQVPSEVIQEIITCSPFLKLRTPEPTSSITPTPSCPSVVPGLQEGVLPCRIPRSVPQIVVLIIFTRASVGFSMTGLGMSFNAIFPGPPYTS